MTMTLKALADLNAALSPSAETTEALDEAALLFLDIEQFGNHPVDLDLGGVCVPIADDPTVEWIDDRVDVTNRVVRTVSL
jgi:hypothetical protein